MPPKYQKGDELTVWFKFSDGRKEISAIGTVQSIRDTGRQYPLYQLTGCATPDGLYVAYEYEMLPTTPEDKALLQAQVAAIEGTFDAFYTPEK